MFAAKKSPCDAINTALKASESKSLCNIGVNSTEEIQQMIEITQKLIHAVVEVISTNVDQNESNISSAELADEGLMQLNEVKNEIVEMNMQIATATEEQSSIAKEICASVVHINDSVELSA